MYGKVKRSFDLFMRYNTGWYSPADFISSQGEPASYRQGFKVIQNLKLMWNRNIYKRQLVARFSLSDHFKPCSLWLISIFHAFTFLGLSLTETRFEYLFFSSNEAMRILLFWIFLQLSLKWIPILQSAQRNCFISYTS